MASQPFAQASLCTGRFPAACQGPGNLVPLAATPCPRPTPARSAAVRINRAVLSPPHSRRESYRGERRCWRIAWGSSQRAEGRGARPVAGRIRVIQKGMQSPPRVAGHHGQNHRTRTRCRPHRTGGQRGSRRPIGPGDVVISANPVRASASVPTRVDTRTGMARSPP